MAYCASPCICLRLKDSLKTLSSIRLFVDAKRPGSRGFSNALPFLSLAVILAYRVDCLREANAE